MMRYPTGAYAFRQRFGEKRQVFQINSKAATEDALKALSLLTLQKLNANENVDDVKHWAKAQIHLL